MGARPGFQARPFRDFAVVGREPVVGHVLRDEPKNPLLALSKRVVARSAGRIRSAACHVYPRVLACPSRVVLLKELQDEHNEPCHLLFVAIAE